MSVQPSSLYNIKSPHKAELPSHQSGNSPGLMCPGSDFSCLSCPLCSPQVVSVHQCEHLAGDALLRFKKAAKQGLYPHIPRAVGDVDGWPHAVSAPTARLGGVTGSGLTQARA